MPRENHQQRSVRLNLYQAYTESGQTIAEFSRERGTTPWKVRHAIRKTEEDASAKSGFQEVAIGAPMDGNAEYGVTLRNGRELRIPSHFTEKRVRQLVEILETC